MFFRSWFLNLRGRKNDASGNFPQHPTQTLASTMRLIVVPI
jgi:hypothetical protein